MPAPPDHPAIIIARLLEAPVGLSPWVILGSPEIPAATLRRTWATIVANPPAQYLEYQFHLLSAASAVAYSSANPALADRAAYIAEAEAPLASAKAAAAEALAAFRAAEEDVECDPNDPFALKAKREADARAHAAAQAVRRLESELHRRHRVNAGLQPLDKTLDGTLTPLRPLPAPLPAAAPSSAPPQKKAAKKPAPAPEAPPSDGVSG